MTFLGRLEPTDWKHLEKFPLRSARVDALPSKPTPVVIGINWYADYDEPVWDDHYKIWRIGNDPKNLGRLRGGHAIEVPNKGHGDSKAWYNYYNQGETSQCVGYSISRMMTHLNRVRYDPQWLYIEAQKIDEWPGEGYDGTSVRAGLEILRTRGHRRLVHRFFGSPYIHEEDLSDGIEVYRWTLDIAEIKQCIQNQLSTRYNAIPLMQSWGGGGHREGNKWRGAGYPHIVWMFDDTAQLMLDQNGEAGIVTDR